MNYNWKQVSINRCESDNTILVYDVEVSEGEIRAIIYITPQINDFGKKRAIFSRFYFRMSRQPRDSLFHAVSDDVFELCERIFDKEEIYKTAFNEYNIVSKMPSVNPFTFGDYSKSE